MFKEKLRHVEKNHSLSACSEKDPNHIGTTSMSCTAFGRQEELLSSQLVCFKKKNSTSHHPGLFLIDV